MEGWAIKKDNRTILERIQDNIIDEVLYDEDFRGGEIELLDAIKQDIENYAFPKMAIYCDEEYRPKLTEKEEEIYLDIEVGRIDTMANEIYQNISKALNEAKEVMH